jgi:hypothetical protein
MAVGNEGADEVGFDGLDEALADILFSHRWLSLSIVHGRRLASQCTDKQHGVFEKRG